MREQKLMGERVRKRRKHLRLGLVDIATPLGLTPYQVTQLEKGDIALERAQLVDLARVLKTSLNYLLNNN